MYTHTHTNTPGAQVDVTTHTHTHKYIVNDLERILKINKESCSMSYHGYNCGLCLYSLT